jgi:hypothetical protein
LVWFGFVLDGEIKVSGREINSNVWWTLRCVALCYIALCCVVLDCGVCSIREACALRAFQTLEGFSFYVGNVLFCAIYSKILCRAMQTAVKRYFIVRFF